MIRRPNSTNLDTAVATYGDDADGFAVDPESTGVSFAGALRSELLKLLWLRSTTWLLVVTVLMYAGLTVLNGMTIRFMAEDRNAVDAAAGEGTGAMTTNVLVAEAPLMATYLAIIVLGALGVITITTEYASGSIRSSLAAVPRRGMLFAAKGIALTLYVSVVSVAVVLLSYVLTLPFAIFYDLVPSLADPDVLVLYLTHALSMVLCALIGFGAGAVFRSTAGGIVTVALLIFVLPLVLQIFAGLRPGSHAIDAFIDAMPLVLMMEFVSVGADQGWAAGAGLVAWAAAAVIPGAVLTMRRDA